MTKSFEELSQAEVEALPALARARYERWFSSWMASGFAHCANDTFDLEEERRDGWGYQAEEHKP